MTLQVPGQTLDTVYVIRPVTLDDLEAGVALIHAEQVEHHGQATETVERLRSEWESPGFELAKSTRAFFTPDGKIAGYCEIWDTRQMPVRPVMWGYVHPDYRGQGIGTWLVQWCIQRARDVFDRVPDDARVVLETGAYSTDHAAKKLLEDNGLYYRNQSWLNMAIVLANTPPAPVWAEGITLLTFDEYEQRGGTLKDLYLALREAFQDHRGYIEEPVEAAFLSWEHHYRSDDLCDHTLWFLAMDGDRIAGASLCRMESWSNPDEAYVQQLGVRREYRKRGLGLALLLHSFGAVYNRGKRRMALHVDGSSLTGATRLYEKAGMHVHKAYDAYEIELRPGRELSKQ